MRICQVTIFHDWKDDRVFERACYGLAARNYDVHLVVPKKPGDYVLSEKEKEIIANNDTSTIVEKVHIHWLKHRSRLMTTLLSGNEACKLALSLKPDIIHFHEPQLIPWMVRLKRRNPHIKVIYDIHENFVQFFQRRNLPKWMERSFRRYEQYAISKLDGFTTITNSLADIFRPYNKNNILIPNVPFLQRLIDLDINLPKEDVPILLSSGIQSDERNCKQLVAAMPYVIKEHPNAILRMAGRYSPETFEQDLLALAAEKGVSQNVEVLHQIPWLENFKRTARSYAGLVSYKITENNKIGMPNRIFETMVCSLPVIATDLPELRRLVTENNCGLVADTDNPEEIAKAMNYLLSHPDEAKKMGENGRKAVLEKYNYEKVLDDTITFYNNLLNADKL